MTHKTSLKTQRVPPVRRALLLATLVGVLVCLVTWQVLAWEDDLYDKDSTPEYASICNTDTGAGMQDLSVGQVLHHESIDTRIRGDDMHESPTLALYRLKGIRFNRGGYEVRVSTLGSHRWVVAVKLAWMPCHPTPPKHADIRHSTPDTPSTSRRLTDISKVMFRAAVTDENGEIVDGASSDREARSRRRIAFPTEGHDEPLVSFRTTSDLFHHFGFAPRGSPMRPPARGGAFNYHLGDYPVEAVKQADMELYAVVWISGSESIVAPHAADESDVENGFKRVPFTIALDRMHLGQFPTSAAQSLLLLVVPFYACFVFGIPALMRVVRSG